MASCFWSEASCFRPMSSSFLSTTANSSEHPQVGDEAGAGDCGGDGEGGGSGDSDGGGGAGERGGGEPGGGGGGGGGEGMGKGGEGGGGGNAVSGEGVCRCGGPVTAATHLSTQKKARIAKRLCARNGVRSCVGHMRESAIRTRACR